MPDEPTPSTSRFTDAVGEMFNELSLKHRLSIVSVIDEHGPGLMRESFIFGASVGRRDSVDFDETGRRNRPITSGIPAGARV